MRVPIYISPDYIPNDVMKKNLMGWKLNIIVWKSGWELWAEVIYKGCTYTLPKDLDTLFQSLYYQTNWKQDVAEVIYEKLEKEVNELLAEYQMREAAANVTQFKFPRPHVTPITIGATPHFTLEDYASAREAELRVERRRMAADLPTAYAPTRERIMHETGIECLTPEEYDEKKERWELGKWMLYVVLN